MRSDRNQHHSATPRIGAGRRAVRIGLLATVSLGAIATATSAQATPSGSHAVGIAIDSARTVANPAARTRFDDSFTVHQYGTLSTATARNSADAESVACTAARPCRSVALSFQIVTMAGENIHLNVSNESHANNYHCADCQTLAGAYQFVVSTASPFTLNGAAQRQLAVIHHKLDALRTSKASVDAVKAQADALAAQVTTILKTAAATAPKPKPDAHGHVGKGPSVAMHRTFSH